MGLLNRLFGSKDTSAIAARGSVAPASSGPSSAAPLRSTVASESGHLDAVLILFNREFGPKDQIVDSILSRMIARGRPYRQSMTPRTKLSSGVVSDPQNAARYGATAMIQFRMMLGSQADLKKVEVANFQGSDGVYGVILSHWS